tara:strand:+ start:208 stop:510 length:303 start_codon:yes stop_codon:yes gene_type:complete
MPQLYNDLWLLAASQDLYNGRKVDQQNAAWVADCETKGISESEAANGEMCGKYCGACALVSGPEGSAIFMINEIADYGAVKTNGWSKYMLIFCITAIFCI